MDSATSNKDGVSVDATTTPVPSMQDKRTQVRPPRVPLPVKCLLSLFSALFIASGILIPWAFVWENQALHQEKKFRQNDTAFLSMRLDELVAELKNMKHQPPPPPPPPSLELPAGGKDPHEQMQVALAELRADVASQEVDQRAAVAAVSTKLQLEKMALKQDHAHLKTALEGAQTSFQTTLEAEQTNIKTALEGKHSDLEKNVQHRLQQQQRQLRRAKTELGQKNADLKAELNGKHAHLTRSVQQQQEDQWWWLEEQQRKQQHRQKTQLQGFGRRTRALEIEKDKAKTALEQTNARLESRHESLNRRTEAVENRHAEHQSGLDSLQTAVRDQATMLQHQLDSAKTALEKQQQQQQQLGWAQQDQADLRQRTGILETETDTPRQDLAGMMITVSRSLSPQPPVRLEGLQQPQQAHQQPSLLRAAKGWKLLKEALLETHRREPAPKGALLQHHQREFVDDRPHGHGKMTFRDGSVYEGESANGKPNGWGKMTLKDGPEYDCTFCTADGKTSSMKITGGRVYQGEFENGMPHGRVTITFKSGQVYQGNFVTGMPDGRGSIRLSFMLYNECECKLAGGLVVGGLMGWRVGELAEASSQDTLANWRSSQVGGGRQAP